MSDKPRKTRLKGTKTKKPCFDCGQTKDRFREFKPRWAGCAKHVTDRGRRYYQEGCEDCEAKVNGNIRQPRCIECDRNRPKKAKKAKKAKAAAKPEPVTVVPKPVTVAPVPEPSPKAVAVPEPEPVTVAPVPEPSPKAVAVPEPEPEPEPKQPEIASMSDFAKLFGSADDGQVTDDDW